MSIKSDLLEKIKRKAQRQTDLTEKIANRNKNVEAYIMEMVDELDTVVSSTVNTSLMDTPHFKQHYIGSIENRIRALDIGATIEISWSEKDPTPGTRPHVNGILVKWSPAYQLSNLCEPELFVDIFSLLIR